MKSFSLEKKTSLSWYIKTQGANVVEILPNFLSQNLALDCFYIFICLLVPSGNAVKWTDIDSNLLKDRKVVISSKKKKFSHILWPPLPEKKWCPFHCSWSKPQHITNMWVHSLILSHFSVIFHIVIYMSSIRGTCCSRHEVTRVMMLFTEDFHKTAKIVSSRYCRQWTSLKDVCYNRNTSPLTAHDCLKFWFILSILL